MQIDEIFEANKRLKNKKRITPLLNSPFLDEIAGRKIFIKAECLQHTGSFKFRGAYSAISSLPIEKRKKGVIAYSCLLYTSPSPRDGLLSRMPSSA